MAKTTTRAGGAGAAIGTMQVTIDDGVKPGWIEMQLEIGPMAVSFVMPHADARKWAERTLAALPEAKSPSPSSRTPASPAAKAAQRVSAPSGSRRR